jgi:hypothetical protein
MLEGFAQSSHLSRGEASPDRDDSFQIVFERFCGRRERPIFLRHAFRRDAVHHSLASEAILERKLFALPIVS